MITGVIEHKASEPKHVATSARLNERDEKKLQTTTKHGNTHFSTSDFLFVLFLFLRTLKLIQIEFKKKKKWDELLNQTVELKRARHGCDGPAECLSAW